MSENRERNPFHEVCLFLSEQGNDFALAELIKRFGFTVYAFVDLNRMCAHLKAQPLTAATFVLGDLVAVEERIQESYKGPLFELAADSDQIFEDLGSRLREVHRNQMKVDDPKILRILRSLNAFVHEEQNVLLLHGESAGLDLAYEFLSLFCRCPFVEVEDVENIQELDADPVVFVTRNLFSQEISEQQKWAVLFGSSETRKLVMEEKSADDLDQLYTGRKVDEALFERLSFRQVCVDPLEGSSFETLCVQPVDRLEARVVVDIDTTNLLENDKEEPVSSDKSGLNGFLSRFLGRS